MLAGQARQPARPPSGRSSWPHVQPGPALRSSIGSPCSAPGAAADADARRRLARGCRPPGAGRCRCAAARRRSRGALPRVLRHAAAGRGAPSGREHPLPARQPHLRRGLAGQRRHPLRERRSAGAPERPRARAWRSPRAATPPSGSASAAPRARRRGPGRTRRRWTRRTQRCRLARGRGGQHPVGARGEGPAGSHERGTVDSNSASFSKLGGLARWRSKPASAARCRSSGMA